MSKKFNSIVFIGRFQPVHNAHVEIIRRAQAMADRVIIVIGSTNEPRTVKNPFTVDERKELLIAALSGFSAPLPIIRSAEDHPYNDQAWAVNVVREVAPFLHGKTGIIGHLKDETSFYLRMFPQWEFIDQTEVEPLHASDLRNLYFTSKPNLNFFKGVAPASTLQFLEEFRQTPQFAQLVREREHIDTYKKQFAGLPYEPVFVTADACVIQSGHVLMVTRRSEPGKGLLALPGGFLNAKIDRSMEDCMIRELAEETGIKVPEKVLRGNIKEAKVFDAIERSSRGRTITHAFKIILPEGEWKLPKVKGADDAEHAEWLPIATLDRSKVFEDHYSIIQYFLGQ
jgi:bifunctional NMN adenylyltransferase/nudix hydrolase